VQLLFIEKLHLIRSKDPISIQIYALEPDIVMITNLPHEKAFFFNIVLTIGAYQYSILGSDDLSSSDNIK
jgi:hypothetical protein